MKVEMLGEVLCRLQKILDNYRKEILEEQYVRVTKILNEFQEWQKGGGFTADDLYMLIIYSEEDEGIFEYAESDFLPEDEELRCMWQVLLSALMAVVRIAYEQEGKPCQQDVDAIKLSEVEGFYQCILDDKMDIIQLFHYFCEKVCY